MIDNKIIANLKTLGIDMIHTAGSGHPGIVLGAAPIIYTVYAKHMNINVNDPKWVNRDRFVMSAGHGSALLYATLYMAGYDISMDDLKNFRRFGYKTPGHPEYRITPGVDMSTGPLGQGFATAVGMALGEKILESKYFFEKKGMFDDQKSLIKYNVYVLCGDGDLMEGVSYEAASLAGTLNLDSLIVLYDSNNISLDGDTSNTFVENVCDRFKAMGWYTETVKNGTSTNDIDKAIERAKKSGKPSFIEVKTIIGDGSMLAGTNEVHGKDLKDDDINLIKEKLQMPKEAFYVDNEAMIEFRKMISTRSARKYEIWAHSYNEYVTEKLKGDKTPLDYLFQEKINLNIINRMWNFETDKKQSLRSSNGEIMNIIAKSLPNLIGGSADLSSSTKTYLHHSNDIKDGHYDGRNIWFGVREHAMGAILNGLALTNFKPYGSTFLAFSDYVKPAIRMSALMNLPVTYIFTHDSINIGQDGPTHQPIEQISMLRAIPNINVYRPADAREIVGCWQAILMTNSPSALILGRNDVDLLRTSSAKNTLYGAYILHKELEKLDAIIIATGSEVHTAYHIAYDLYKEKGLDIRVVSMPCMDLFKLQPQNYKEQVLPQNVKTFVIEAGASSGWEYYASTKECLITIDHFGASGTKDEVERYCQFSYNEIKEKILTQLK